MDGVLFLLHKKGSGIKGARVPDVSFVRKENFPKDWNIEEPIPGAPNLAVEIMSPNDSAVETLKRVRDYLRAGTEQVWVVYPSQKEVHQYRRNESPETALLYTGGDAIDTGSLFPGLEITTSAFFVLPEWFNKK